MTQHNRPPVVVPEYQDSGDPQWIDVAFKDGGAEPGDHYLGYGRWRERIYPSKSHPADQDPEVLGRVGLKRAVARLEDALRPDNIKGPPDRDPASANDDPIAHAIVAAFDALEWTHSLDEHLRLRGVYKTASAVDPVYGEYVLGAIGARNASHHGLRRVLGVAEVPRAIYKVKNARWEHSGTYSNEHVDEQVRWVERLPLRTEPDESRKPALRYKDQEEAYNKHLAGREVRNTFRCILLFFAYTARGLKPPSNYLFTPAQVPPPLSPSVSTQDPAYGDVSPQV